MSRGSFMIVSVNSVSGHRSGAKIQKSHDKSRGNRLTWLNQMDGGEKWVPETAKLARSYTHKTCITQFNATFGRGLIQLLRTMRYVFGMHA